MIKIEMILEFDSIKIQVSFLNEVRRYSSY